MMVGPDGLVRQDTKPAPEVQDTPLQEMTVPVLAQVILAVQVTFAPPVMAF
jgi:hypothetical protein